MQEKVLGQKRAEKKSNFWNKGKMDISFLVLLLIIVSVGLVMLFSASYDFAYTNYGNYYKFIVKQAGFAVVGLILMYIISRIDYHFWRKLVWLVYAAAIFMLLFLLVMPPMVSGTSVKRWLVIGPINFQPSEVAKFAIILLLAHMISLHGELMNKFWYSVCLLGLGVAGVPIILTALEPHLSAAILMFLIALIMIIVGGLPVGYVLFGVGAAGAGAALLFSGVISYAKDRITYWLNPWADPSGSGYQTIQSLLAIGSGALLGRGLGNSRQKYLWVPEPHNDFIFAIVCEELGFVGALIIVILFALLVWRGFSIAAKAKDKFGTMLALGLTFQVGIQVVLNILVVTNTLPNTGISLPFFSYGGTSLLILLCQMGIILSVSRSSKMEKV